MLSAIRTFWPMSAWSLAGPTAPSPVDKRTLLSVDVPKNLVEDVGIMMDRPLADRREMFWRQSTRLGHRGLPY